MVQKSVSLFELPLRFGLTTLFKKVFDEKREGRIEHFRYPSARSCLKQGAHIVSGITYIGIGTPQSPIIM